MLELASKYPLETVVIVLMFFALVGRIVPGIRRPPED
jgi:hypothetical protein